MKYQHVDPEEAVRIHIDVQTRKSVAIHWGTFALANEVSLIVVNITLVMCLTREGSSVCFPCSELRGRTGITCAQPSRVVRG